MSDASFTISPLALRSPLFIASALLALGLSACGGDDVGDLTPTDTGTPPVDLGSLDAGVEDAEATDTGTTDGGDMDAGAEDTGVLEPFETIRTTGLPEQRIDIVFIGDGYTEEELGSVYERHVGHVANRMFSRVRNGSTEPFRQFRNLFNVHRINLVSPESGVDEMDQTVDTALDGSTRCADLGGVCYIDTAKTAAAVEAALADSDIEPDVIMVALNTLEPVEGLVEDANGRFAVYGGGPRSGNTDVDTSERGLRQLARLMAGVAINDPGTGDYSGGEPMAANLTVSSTGAKWSAWVGFNAPNDGQGEVNSFEGGGGFSTGVFRPVAEDKMTGDYPAPYDPVTREAIILSMFEILPAIVGNTANSGTLMNPDFLDAIPSDGDLIEVQWFVDGEDTTVPGGRLGFFAWAQANAIAAGPHTVEARYSTRTQFRFPDCRGCDGSTQDFVRRPSPSMSGSVTWQVIYRP